MFSLLFVEQTLINDTDIYDPDAVTDSVPNEDRPYFSEDYQVGDIVQFGAYEQDGNQSNGKEPIDWIVLEKQDDKILLLSKLILDNQSYHTKNEQVTWETCDLRNWLNNDFINIAFTAQEQLLLLETKIITPDFDAGSIEYSDGRVFHNLYLDGSVVTDRCFILSYEEIEYYFKDDKRKATSSNYSKKNFDYWYIRSGNCNQVQTAWWDRNDTIDLFFSPVMYGDGKLMSVVTQASKGHGYGVRPAIWVSTNK